MLRLFFLTGGLFALCLALIGGTHALARRDPPPRVAALLPDAECPAPCWQGLRPGAIRPEALQNWLDDPPGGWQADPIELDATQPGVLDSWQVPLPDAAPLNLIVVRIHSPFVDELILLQADLTLGDIIAALGEPDSIGFNLGSAWDLEFRLYYPAPRLIVEGVIPAHTAYLSPTTPVGTLVYEAMLWSRPILAFDWRGFGSITRYYPHGVVP